MSAAAAGQGVTRPDGERGHGSLAGERVLVTGARGFVGRRLARQLSFHGAVVSRLVHMPPGASADQQFSRATALRFASASVTDLSAVAELIQMRGITTVYHLAAMNSNRGTDVSPYALFEANIRGTYTVLEACRMAKTAPRAVLVSSREAEVCFDPHGAQAIHPYAASKAASELIATSYADTFGLKVATLRTGNIYGEGDLNWRRLIPSVIRSILMEQPPVITGSLTARRDYIHVDDVVAACIWAAEHAGRFSGADGTIRISSGVHTSTAEILRMIATEMDRRDLIPEGVGQPGSETPGSQARPMPETKTPGWTSKIGLDDGLARTVRWYRRLLCRSRSH